MLRKRRLPIFMVLIGLFIVFWFVYMALILSSTGRVFRDQIETRVAETTGQLQARHALDLAGLSRQVYTALDGEPAEVERVARVAKDITPRDGTGDILVADGEGMLYTAEGPTRQRLSGAALAAADGDGSYVQSITLLSAGAEGVATILPLVEGGPYLVQVQSAQEYALGITGLLTFEPECYTLFDEWGQAVAHVGETGEGHDAVTASLARGVEDYHAGRSTETVVGTGLFFDYNIFIPLPLPEGWMMGGHVSSAQVFPQFQSFFLATLIPLALWLVLLVLLIVYSVAQRQKKKKELYMVSRIDPLTRLSNSSGMDAAMQRFFRQQPMQDYAMVCMDIVAFHRFNTMFGYATGDNLLRVLGKTLLEEFDCGTRTSGDTFTFLVKNQPDVLERVERILYDAVRTELGRQYVQVVSFNFGIFPILDDNHTLREIYDGALLALKDAKKSPERNTVVYDYELQQRADIQKEIEVNMLHALSKEEFLPYIQPKFSTRDDACCGGEVLVRWESEQMGFLSPALFIPVFEANGFIVEVDFFILEKTLSLQQRQYDAGEKLLPLSVNQSRVTITFPNYLDRLARLVKNYTVPLEYIEVEITENALVSDYDLVLSLVSAYKQMGFSVAMDDFGSGYSSLNTLREIPVDVLKIDKEFLRESDKSERSRKIIHSIINMAVDLGICTVCEGVEEPAQYAFLKSAGCEMVQGFLFSKPIPGGDYVKNYLTEHKDKKTLPFPG